MPAVFWGLKALLLPTLCLAGVPEHHQGDVVGCWAALRGWEGFSAALPPSGGWPRAWVSPAEDSKANEDVDVGWGTRFCPRAAVFHPPEPNPGSGESSLVE